MTSPAPTITGVSPASGPTGGGTTVTITGTNFTGASAVTFGGTAASYTFDSPTQITTVAPAHAAGAVDVVVTTPGGTATSTGGFTYVVPAPTITGIAPTSGTTAGGTTVTITGTNLTGATAVTFGGTAATGVTVVSPTQITATTPAHAAGAVDVAVTTPGGTATSTGGFTYVVPAPTITGVSPTSGTTAGGTTVTITGTNLSGASAVTFGGTAATGVTVVSPTQITATTPAHAAGAVDVTVTTPGGSATATGGFTYVVPAPTITGIAPATGTTAGGTTVTITGTNLSGATAVTFGGTAATGVTVVSPTQITATTPAHAAGAVDVVVTTPGGTATATGGFTYAAPPSLSIDDLSLSEGDSGTVSFDFTVSLSAPAPAGGVNFDITSADNTANAGSDYFLHSLTGQTIPAGSSTYSFFVLALGDTTVEPNETFFVNVTNITGATGADTQGQGTIINDDGALPTITGIVPASGPTAGGTTVTITGTDFTGATAVTFGGTAAASYTVDSATQITAVTPAHAAGAVDVVVTTPGGSAMATGGFTYTVLAPAITGITPTTGTTAGGTTVTITGTDFTGATAITFGGTAAASYIVDSATQITAVTPAHAAGAVDVVVTAPGGSATATGGFTYVVPVPTITGIAPASGPIGGGTSVVITGTNLTGASAVTFGGTAAASYTVVSATQINATTAAHAAGAADVAVTTPGGSATVAGGFTFLTPAPTITGIVPASGSTAGGTTVTITGTNLTGASAVAFGGTAAASYTVDSATQITATTPAHAAGAVDVVVTTSGGPATATGGFTYVAPVTLTLTPPAGALPAGEVGTAYAQTFTASGGSGNYSYAVTAGALPASLTLASDGTLSGTPTAVANASFTITATDTVTPANSGSAAYTLLVNAPPSDDATLSGLAASAGTLNPVFDPGTLGYSLAVGNEVETLTVTPTASDPAATITVAGQTVGSGAASQPIALIVGANDIPVVVTAENGTTVRTYTLTVTRAPLARPDPSEDAEVIGLLNAQAGAARRFAQTQMTNFHRRLEQLHDEGERRTSSLDVRLGIAQTDPSSRGERQIERMIEAGHGAAATETPDLLAYAPAGATPGADDGAAYEREDPGSNFAVPDLGPFAIWSGGFVNFGEREDGLDLDYTMVGVSGGIDYRFSERFVAGFGAGYGRDRADIGENGTQSRAGAFSAAVYGSYKPADKLFIDGLLGGSWLDFDSRRFVTANGEFAAGSRSGTQLFGSLSAAYEFRDETWLISPYGRVEFSRSWLDGFTESGGGSYGLTYGDQTIDVLSGVLGVRASYTVPMSWGALKPGVRAEYTHDFEGSSRASLGYTDLGGLPYPIDIDPWERDYFTLGLSLDFQFANEMNLGFDYRTSFSESDDREHAFGMKFGARF